MKMAYWMRIALGALLGLGALVGLWLGPGIGWLTAIVASLVALLGFLGSYFVVSADRPSEGYEQVLFDKPNTLVAIVLALTFAGAGFSTGFLGRSDAPSSVGERATLLYAQYQSDANAYSAAQDKDAAKDAALAQMTTLRGDSDLLNVDIEALPEGDTQKTDLMKANDDLAIAIDSMVACIGGDLEACKAARFAAADVQSSLGRLGLLE
jgi:hypothetical protein